MSQHDEYQQPVAEVLQLEEEAPVKVEVVNTVATKALPALSGDLSSVTVPVVGQVENVAVGDPRRSRLVLTSDKAVRLSTSRDGARNSNAYLLAAGQQLSILHRDEVWARATVADTTVSVSVERWAD